MFWVFYYRSEWCWHFCFRIDIFHSLLVTCLFWSMPVWFHQSLSSYYFRVAVLSQSFFDWCYWWINCLASSTLIFMNFNWWNFLFPLFLEFVVYSRPFARRRPKFFLFWQNLTHRIFAQVNGPHHLLKSSSSYCIFDGFTLYLNYVQFILS